MKNTSRVFATDVELQCRVVWGAEARFEFSGTAVSIDSGSMVLRFAPAGAAGPEVGERVELEVLLPVNFKNAAAKCLSFRAEVVRVTETPDGERQLNLNFRRAAFRDLGEAGRPKAQKSLKRLNFQ